MNTGKTLFAQIIDFLPRKTFHRIVARHGGDKGVRSLTCAEQFRAMVFAQLTHRESLRGIEAGLLAQAAKLYHMAWGFANRCIACCLKKAIQPWTTLLRSLALSETGPRWHSMCELLKPHEPRHLRSCLKK